MDTEPRAIELTSNNDYLFVCVFSLSSIVGESNE